MRGPVRAASARPDRPADASGEPGRTATTPAGRCHGVGQGTGVGQATGVAPARDHAGAGPGQQLGDACALDHGHHGQPGPVRFRAFRVPGVGLVGELTMRTRWGRPAAKPTRPTPGTAERPTRANRVADPLVCEVTALCMNCPVRVFSWAAVSRPGSGRRTGRRDGRPVLASARSAQLITCSPALAPSQRSGSVSQRGERCPTQGSRGDVGVAGPAPGRRGCARPGWWWPRRRRRSRLPSRRPVARSRPDRRAPVPRHARAGRPRCASPATSASSREQLRAGSGAAREDGAGHGRTRAGSRSRSGTARRGRRTRTARPRSAARR